MNNMQLPKEEEDAKYLGLHLDRRLPGANIYSPNRNNCDTKM
jgi:hypothetical protein